MARGKSSGTMRRTRVVRVFRKRIALAVREAEKAAARADKALARCRELVKLFEILSAPAPAVVPAQADPCNGRKPGADCADCPDLTCRGNPKFVPDPRGDLQLLRSQRCQDEQDEHTATDETDLCDPGEG